LAELEILKKEPSSKGQMKNIAESLSNRLDQVGKRISELEDRCF
jgi:hypothetical protein